MPAKAEYPRLTFVATKDKSWIPAGACPRVLDPGAGMTGAQRRCVNRFAGWPGATGGTEAQLRRIWTD